MITASRNARIGGLLFVLSFAVFTLALYGGAKLVEEERTAATDDGDFDIPTGPVTVRITSRNLLFDTRQIVAAAGQRVTVIHDNQDVGVLHNVAFYTTRAATTRIFVGELFAGPRVVEESFTAPSAPGSYFFRCDVHPDTMTGTFIVR